MEEFVGSYGLWILLGVVFIAMHRFGMGCGGGHQHASGQADDPQRTDEREDPGVEKKAAATGRSRRCH